MVSADDHEMHVASVELVMVDSGAAFSVRSGMRLRSRSQAARGK